MINVLCIFLSQVFLPFLSPFAIIFNLLIPTLMFSSCILLTVNSYALKTDWQFRGCKQPRKVPILLSKTQYLGYRSKLSKFRHTGRVFLCFPNLAVLFCQFSVIFMNCKIKYQYQNELFFPWIWGKHMLSLGSFSILLINISSIFEGIYFSLLVLKPLWMFSTSVSILLHLYQTLSPVAAKNLKIVFKENSH